MQNIRKGNLTIWAKIYPGIFPDKIIVVLFIFFAHLCFFGEKTVDIKINASWFRFLEELPAEEIKKVIRAIWDYTQGKEVPDIHSAAWETIKASIDSEIQHKAEVSEKRRNAIKCRWDKIKKTSSEVEVIEPKENKFSSLTDDLSIWNELEKPDSVLSVFLATGSGYDELNIAEREFVDRPDVRKLCPWYKEKPVQTRVIKDFVSPTLEQVLEYARQQNSIAGVGGFACSDTDAEEFWSYYEAQSWRIGNESDTPIRDWKPKLRQWCVRNTKQKQPGNFMPRLSLKEMKQIQNEIELEKIRKGEK